MHSPPYLPTLPLSTYLPIYLYLCKKLKCEYTVTYSIFIT
jgi:hypothetical protein